MRFTTVAGLTVALLSPLPARAVDYVSDPLTASTFAGRGSMGGTFSASGWTVTAESDAVWYEIADALPTGRVEYTATGLSLSVPSSLTGADHDIFTMYQAPTGQAEPIAYMPGFRNNDFKMFTRIFGTQEVGRPGAMKLELAFCPRGDPWYHDEVCTSSCDGSGLAYASGNQNDVGWNVAAAYRMAVAWGSGEMTFYRDGTALGTVPYPGEWAPQPLRVRLGSPRHDGVYPGAAFMPIGMTIRDVLIQGTPGTMTPVCNPVLQDAGMPDAAPPPDAGPPDGYAALADVTAASWEAGVFSDTADLNAEADASGQPLALVYLRFPAVSGTVTNATLRLHTHSYASAAGGAGSVCAVADDTWDETTMTWATRPTVGLACVGKSLSVDPDMDVYWDVTSLVPASGTINLAVATADPNAVHYMSKEAGDLNKAPRLTVLTVPSDDAGAGGSGGSGGAGQGGTGHGGAGGGSSSGGAGSVAGGDDGGCGCRAVGRSAPPMGLALLAVLALRSVGRRRLSSGASRRPPG
jgi:uncharacterized membrane protein YgcG